MEAIKSFFVDLAKAKGLKDEADFVYITGPALYVQQGSGSSQMGNNLNNAVSEANYVLSIKNNNFLKKVLIPFFDSMS